MNSKLLNQLLSEWSLRSPDGLAAGHSTPENMSILQEILSDADFSKEEMDEIMGNVLSIDPTFLTEDPIDDAQSSANKLSSELEYLGLPTAKSLETEAIDMLVKKGIKSDNYPEKILNIIRSSKVLINQDVAKKFDTMTVAEAVKYLNTDFAGKEFSDKLNNLVEKKGLGRGEYALLFFIKNAVSGGTGTGDLIINNQVIDVKEFSSGAIRIPAPSLRLKFTEFYRDFFELVNYLIKHPMALKYLTWLIETGKVELTKLKPAGKAKVIEWINDPDASSLPASVVDGLYEIGKFLKKNDEEDAEIVDLKFKGQPPQPMVMMNPDDVKQKIAPTSAPDAVEITVEPLVDRLSQVTIPEIKNLGFFVKNRTREEITSELLKNTYNGGMIVIDEKSRKYIWWKRNELPNKLRYKRMSQGGTSYFEPR